VDLSAVNWLGVLGVFVVNFLIGFAWFNGKTYDAIAIALEEAGIPFSKIYTIADIEKDPHYIARQAIVRLPDPDYGSLPAPCIVPRIVGREMPIPRTGPAVGEHNAQVYAEFGIDETELVRLREAKVI
jgi:crotonobetainyl-CoA:carnitine CoA-transferase CaiB-like acyl-CoA transferase